MRILLMGPPGSGKGTQGAMLAEQLHIEHIAVGDLLRAEVTAGTPLGHQVAATMQAGDLIPDDLVIELMAPTVTRAAANGGYILDGFPRTLMQAVAARQTADEFNVDADIVIWLDISPQVLIGRLSERAGEQGRADDTAETVSRRLQVYEEATRPLLDYYQGRGLLATVDASGDAAQVNAAIRDAIGARLPL
jgi:adenylate kinase